MLDLKHVGPGSTIAAYVASRKEPIRIEELQSHDSRFPEGVGHVVTPPLLSPPPTFGGHSPPTLSPGMPIFSPGVNMNGHSGVSTPIPPQVKMVLAYPVTVDESVIGVVEVYRFGGKMPFTQDQEAVWVSFHNRKIFIVVNF